MKFSVNIDQQFMEDARKRYRDEEPQENKENTPTPNAAPQKPLQEVNKQDTSRMPLGDANGNEEQENNKFATSQLLMEAIHQTKVQQKHNRLHLEKMQNTVEDALSMHLDDQVNLVNSYAPNFKTPKYNCSQEYKGVAKCYEAYNGGPKCDQVFREYMRCHNNTKKQYFDLKELWAPIFPAQNSFVQNHNHLEIITQDV